MSIGVAKSSTRESSTGKYREDPPGRRERREQRRLRYVFGPTAMVAVEGFAGVHAMTSIKLQAISNSFSV